MTIQVYKSGDTGAPTLDGQAGSLITVLDACLVDGFDVLPGAGWTKEFSGTNKAVYRNDAVSGSGRYFQVLDNGPYSSNFHIAAVRGYATMSDVDTGIEPFPTVAQRPLGSLIRKAGATGSATVIDWTIIADEQGAYLFLGAGTGWTSTPTKADPVSASCFIGDFKEFYSLDQYAVAVGGANTDTTPTTSTQRLFYSLTSSTDGVYVMRDYAASVGSVSAGSLIDSRFGDQAFSGRSTPGRIWSEATGRELLTRWVVHDASATYPRGTFPGVRALPFEPPASWEHLDTFTFDSIEYTLIAVYANAQKCMVAIQSAGDWRT